jgi:hypothetical protein
MMKRALSDAAVLAAAALYLCLAGCSSTSVMRSDGIPWSKYLVGGGYQVNYKAPANGTAYFVDEFSRKILQTQSLEQGEKFEISISTIDEATRASFRNAGIDIACARFTLYFVPDKGAEL